MSTKPFLVCAAIVAVWLRCCTFADGASMRLGKIDDGYFKAEGASYPLVLTTLGMQCWMGYADPFYDPGNGQGIKIDEQLLSQTVWTDLPLVNGQPVVLDFPVAGNPVYQSIAARLTDGIDERFSDGVFAYNADRFVTSGGFNSIGDDYYNLTGCQIDFFRLIVRQAFWGPPSGPTFRIEASYTWEAYGVPEPSAWCIGGMGAALFAWTQKRTGCGRRRVCERLVPRVSHG